MNKLYCHAVMHIRPRWLQCKAYLVTQQINTTSQHLPLGSNWEFLALYTQLTLPASLHLLCPAGAPCCQHCLQPDTVHHVSHTHMSLHLKNYIPPKTHFTLMQHILKFWRIMCEGDFFFISYFIATLNKTKSFTLIMFWSGQVEYI